MYFLEVTFDMDVSGYSPENPTYYVCHPQSLIHNLRRIIIIIKNKKGRLV